MDVAISDWQQIQPQFDRQLQAWQRSHAGAITCCVVINRKKIHLDNLRSDNLGKVCYDVLFFFLDGDLLASNMYDLYLS